MICTRRPSLLPRSHGEGQDEGRGDKPAAANHPRSSPLLSPRAQGQGEPPSQGPAHADDPVRRRRLRHAAVRAGERAFGDAGADELHQPRPRRLRHGRRLCHGADDGAPRRAVPRHPAGRVSRPGDPRRRPRAHALPPALWREPARPGPVHHRPRADGDADRQFPARRRGAAGQPAAVALRPLRLLRRRASAAIACSSSGSAARSPPRCSSFWSARASARSFARRSTTRASPTGSASTSTASSRSPSRSAAALPASAARWRPTSSAASTRRSRSSSW